MFCCTRVSICAWAMMAAGTTAVKQLQSFTRGAKAARIPLQVLLHYLCQQYFVRVLRAQASVVVPPGHVIMPPQRQR